MTIYRALVVFLLVFSFANSAVGMDHSQMNDQDMGQMPGMSAEDHSAHMKMMEQKNKVSERQANYQVPDVELIDQDGNKVRLPELLSTSEPYAMNFIFTTCTTICPILTASFSHMQHQLGPDADRLQLISISIDPEHDTPGVLKEYAERVGATKNWTFLTGDFNTVVAVEKAFDSYTSDKMNHRPAYLFKTAADDKWHRVDGLASGTELADIYHRLDLF